MYGAENDKFTTLAIATAVLKGTKGVRLF